MKNLWACTLLVVLWLIAAPLPTLAQTGSGLVGAVRDTSGAVLPGVTVEASSPALIEKVRVAVTDGAGHYSITALPPGRYTVTFSLPGFTTVIREGIDLVTGFTGNVNADLPVGGLAESITVTGASPVVDVQNTRQQVVLTRDLIDAVPVGKSFAQLSSMILGVTGETRDVGGLSGHGSGTSLSVRGTRNSDTEQQVDGSTVMGLSGISNSEAWVSDGAWQELVFDVSGASAETETGGVRYNMVPRDGGNTFSGGLTINGAHPSWLSDNLTPELIAQGYDDPSRLKRMYTVNPNFGGPILRDRLWFFANHGRMYVDKYVFGQYLNSCLSCWDYKPDLTRQALDDENALDYSLRLTWQATPRNKFTAFVDDNDHCNCHKDLNRTGSTSGGDTVHTSEAVERGITWVNMYQANWTFTATNRVLVQAGLALHPTPASRENQPEVVAPYIEDEGLGLIYRGNDAPSLTHKQDVNTYRGSVSYVTGSHSMKVGANALTARRQRTNQMFDSLSYTALNGVPTSVTYYRAPFTTDFRIKPNLGVYAQDQWTVRNLTLNLGLRFDYFRDTQPAQTIPPSGYIRQAISAPFLLGAAFKDLQPRVGVAYDLFGNGKTALKATVNRYALRLSLNQSSAVSTLFANSENERDWTDGNNDRIVQGDPFNDRANGELGPSQNLAFGQPGIAFAHYDPDYQKGWNVRPMNWEMTGGVQQELAPGVAVTATLLRRVFGNFPVWENLAQPPSAWDEYCVPAPLDARLPDGGGYQLCGIYDLKPAFVGLNDFVGSRSSEYGKQQEHYTAVDVNLKASVRNLILQGGMYTGKTMTDNCEIVKNVPSSVGTSVGSRGLRPNLSPNGTWCHAESPFLTQFKASGAYTLPWQEIQISGTYQNLPGPEIFARGTYTRNQVLPFLGRRSRGSTTRVHLIEPGSLYDDDRFQQVDVRFAKAVRVGRVRIQGQFDIYNAFNVAEIVGYSPNYGATTGANAGSVFRLPVSVLFPRLIKLGMQLTF